MPSPNLDRLVATGVLHAEPRLDSEFAGLLRSGLTRGDQSVDQRLVSDLVAACGLVAEKVQGLPQSAP